MNNNNEKIQLEIDTTELNELQIRLIKSVVNMLDHVMHTDEEADFFESSSELLRVTSQAIKSSNFSKLNKELPYGEQALQYCVDVLADRIYQDDLVKYDC